MKFIEWTKSLEIGIKEIDDQHKELIKLINNTYNLKKQINVAKILNELTSFARTHFSTEERYFNEWKYPNTTEHMLEHEKLILKVLRFNQLYTKNKQIDLKEFLEFLKDWLENHLKKHDFKYRDYFKEKGYIKNKK